MPCLLIIVTLCTALHDRPAMALTAAQTAALVADGITTRQFVARGHVEADFLARPLIGTRPTWARMIPAGTAEAIAALYLGQKMKHSQNSWLRRLWWLPQAGATFWHGWAAGYNAEAF